MMHMFANVVLTPVLSLPSFTRNINNIENSYITDARYSAAEWY